MKKKALSLEENLLLLLILARAVRFRDFAPQHRKKHDGIRIPI